jgi:hypothetical protein
MDELRAGRLETRNRSTEFLDALKQEMALTAETLGEPLTDLKIVGYLEALSVLRIEQIRMGFQRARRMLKWFPKPSEVRELSALEAQDLEPSKVLPEARPEWTAKDRKEWLDKMSKVAKTIEAAALSEKEREERKEVLRTQAEKLRSKNL